MARIKRDIIDNTEEEAKMYDVLNSEIPGTQRLDISTGYFNVDGYSLIKDTLNPASQGTGFVMRLLFGKQALIPDTTFEQKALDLGGEKSLKSGLDDSELTEEGLSDTTDLISLLKRDNIRVRLGTSRFNHSKCYIMDETVLIGSSNLTAGGMTGNYELNAGLYQPAISDKARVWFDRMWDESEDTKNDLIKLLESSKFGVPADPYEVYIKMIFERYRDLLTPDTDEPEYNIELTKFQKDAVKTAMFVISEFQGVMIADSTGLGKTNMGLEILRQKILKEGKKALLIAPSQVLNSMWEKKLGQSGISVYKKATTESLGREDSIGRLREFRNVDFVIIDESQYFKTKNANRRKMLAKIMATGKRKQVLLLSATPINNSIMDLYQQISIITKGDDEYFKYSMGIPDLYRHMYSAANKEGGLAEGLDKIQRLLDGIMVRRTRSFIREVYKDDTINKKPIKFPNHEYEPIKYSLADLYGNVFERIRDDMVSLTMAPYGLERYNTKATEEERARHKVLAHLQVILLLKRFESSVEAFRRSLDNKIKLYEHINNLAENGRMVPVREINKIIAKGNRLANDDDSDGFDIDEYLLQEIQNMDTQELDKKYDIKKFTADLTVDLGILNALKYEIAQVTSDLKFEAVKKKIREDKALESESGKVLIFTEYEATARYILKKFQDPLPEKDKGKIVCITGSTKPETRIKYIERFAPKSNLLEEQESEDPIDILISTEVLAEGQNLQDCNYVINYDLPWNPMRIVQRIGRIDRLTSDFDTIHVRACYPDRELDGILSLMGTLLDKIHTVNQVGLLDSELLGEAPTPRQYNGLLKDRLKILGEGSGAASDVMKQMERDSDLMPQNTPLNEISRRAKEIGIDELQAMPIGRRSGKAGSKDRCVLAYLREKPNRYVYFVTYDFAKDEALVPENEYDAVNEARCMPDEPLHLKMDDTESFRKLLEIDKKARQAIEKSDNQVRRYKVDPKKQNSYEKTRDEIMAKLSKAHGEGKSDVDRVRRAYDIMDGKMMKAWESELGTILSQFNEDGDTDAFLGGIEKIGKELGEQPPETPVGEEIDYKTLKLVGAMFITGDESGKEKKGMDAFVKE